MAGTLTPTPFQTVLDTDGVAVSGALIYTYVGGTTTNATTYADASLATANANPIVADAAGRFVAYLPAGGNFKFLYKTAAGDLASTVAPFPKATELSLSLRPEALRMIAPNATQERNMLAGVVTSSVYLGGHAQHEVRLANTDATVRVSELNPKNPPAIGDRVVLAIDTDDVVPLAE
jgi:ABC-type Fe3+/spermidine/putrescine transport system ATPase subunit